MDFKFLVYFLLEFVDGKIYSIYLQHLHVGMQFVTIFQHDYRKPGSYLRLFYEVGDAGQFRMHLYLYFEELFQVLRGTISFQLLQQSCPTSCLLLLIIYHLFYFLLGVKTWGVIDYVPFGAKTVVKIFLYSDWVFVVKVEKVVVEFIEPFVNCLEIVVVNGFGVFLKKWGCYFFINFVQTLPLRGAILSQSKIIISEVQISLLLDRWKLPLRQRLPLNFSNSNLSKLILNSIFKLLPSEFN